jgi:hypothetical protein
VLFFFLPDHPLFEGQGKFEPLIALALKTQKLAIFYFILVSKVLNWSSGLEFLIIRDKNRGMFLFIGPHPSSNGTNGGSIFLGIL